MAACKDLAKIGLEGFALIEEQYGRSRRMPVLGQPQSVAAVQPTRRVEPSGMVVEPSPIRCDQLAKAHGGVLIKEWGGKRVNKAPR